MDFCNQNLLKPAAIFSNIENNLLQNYLNQYAGMVKSFILIVYLILLLRAISKTSCTHVLKFTQCVNCRLLTCVSIRSITLLLGI